MGIQTSLEQASVGHILRIISVLLEINTFEK